MQHNLFYLPFSTLAFCCQKERKKKSFLAKIVFQHHSLFLLQYFISIGFWKEGQKTTPPLPSKSRSCKEYTCIYKECVAVLKNAGFHLGSLMTPRHIFILVTTLAVTKLLLTVKAEPNVVLDYGSGPMTQGTLARNSRMQGLSSAS